MPRTSPGICRQAFAAARHDLDFTRVAEQQFASCRSDSIDYAVMEKTDIAAVVPLAAGGATSVPGPRFMRRSPRMPMTTSRTAMSCSRIASAATSMPAVA